ncbi:MAG: acyltransferase family protein [Gaiella sp.]
MSGSAGHGRPPRRYDLDWLRIAAVLLLIPFHTARVFNPGEEFYAKSDETSTALQRFIVFVAPWHMSLLFLLAGCATWFALGFRTGRAYAGERFGRLLVPFLFGLVVIVPPQAYVGMRTNSDADRGWWEQYAYFWTHWEDPESYAGEWTPAHLWFVLFLFVYSLVALVLFLWLRRGGRRVIDAFARACRVPGVVIAVPAALLLLEKAVVPMDDLSGQTPVGFLLLVVLGYVVAADERITAAIDRHWRYALVFGIGVMALRAALWPGNEEYADGSWQDALVEWLGYEIGVWAMIVGLLGLFHVYANRTNARYAYATEGAYPFYVLHQTVIVLIAWWVLGWGLGIPGGFAVIACASLVTTILAYDVAVRRWRPMRFLFGMKPRRPER